MNICKIPDMTCPKCFALPVTETMRFKETEGLKIICQKGHEWTLHVKVETDIYGRKHIVWERPSHREGWKMRGVVSIE